MAQRRVGRVAAMTAFGLFLGTLSLGIVGCETGYRREEVGEEREREGIVGEEREREGIVGEEREREGVIAEEKEREGIIGEERERED